MDQPLSKAERRRRQRRRRVRRILVTGLATLLPAVLTGYIIFLLVRFVHNSLGRWIGLAVASSLGVVDPYATVAGDILAVVIVFVLAYVLGAFTASFVGGRIVRAGEGMLSKVPLVKVIYPYVKQVTDFVLSDKRARFRRVVAVPYPRRGMYSIGFVTGTSMQTINEATQEEMIHIFIPSSPTPVTGYVVFLPRRDVIELSLTVDEALRFAISGGVIVPYREVVALSSAAEAELLEPEDMDEDENEEDSQERGSAAS